MGYTDYFLMAIYLVLKKVKKKKPSEVLLFFMCIHLSQSQLLHITLPTVTLMWVTLAAPFCALWTEHVSQETGH